MWAKNKNGKNVFQHEWCFSLGCDQSVCVWDPPADSSGVRHLRQQLPVWLQRRSDVDIGRQGHHCALRQALSSKNNACTSMILTCVQSALFLIKVPDFYRN